MGKRIIWSMWLLMLVGIFIVKCWKEFRIEKKESVVMAGSAAMETFVEVLTELADKNGIEIKPQYIGSSAGVEALLKGSSQIALVSRELTQEEKNKGVVGQVVAYDGIIIIVNLQNNVKNLSREQIREVFTGKISNWRELGGKDEPIVVIGREYGSGTRTSFEKLLSIEEKTKYSNECDSIGVVKAKVALIKGAIGYVSLEVAVEEEAKVKVISVNQIMPDKKMIEQRKYELVRPFIFATMGEMGQQEANVQKIFKLLNSRQGELVFEKAGVVSATEGE